MIWISGVRKLMIAMADLIGREKKMYPEESINAALWYIFSKKEGRSLSSLLNQTEWDPIGEPLGQKQKIDLMEYIEYFKNTALEHGLLAEYDQTIASIKQIEPTSIMATVLLCIKFLINFILRVSLIYFLSIVLDVSFVKLLVGLEFFYWISSECFERYIKQPEKLIPQFEAAKTQNDFIIRKINKEYIKQNGLNYKARLVVLGWIKTGLPENFTKELLENSKKYWKHYLNNIFFNRGSLTEEDINDLSEVCDKAQEMVRSGECVFQSLVKAFKDIDYIIDNPFVNDAVMQERNKTRESFINKLKACLLVSPEYACLFDKAEAISSIRRKVFFDQDRVAAYKTFFDTESYGNFIEQLTEWSKTEAGIKQLAKFTVPSSIDLESLPNFLNDPMIFKELSRDYILKSLHALLDGGRRSGEILNADIDLYFAIRFNLLVESLEGRIQIVDDLAKLHSIHMFYMQMMLRIVQKNEEDSWCIDRQEQHRLDDLESSMRNLLQDLLLIPNDDPRRCA